MKEYTVSNIQDGNDSFSVKTDDIMEAMLFALNQLGYNITQEDYNICDFCMENESYTKCAVCGIELCTDCMTQAGNDLYYCDLCLDDIKPPMTPSESREEKAINAFGHNREGMR